jgi:precorrin-8X/cobalt-precorrin-8 methylmutase
MSDTASPAPGSNTPDLALPEYDYIRDGAAIYEKSFATIRSEARLDHLNEVEARVAVRVIHACGMVDVVGDMRFTSGFAHAARAALRNGAPILCDAKMVASGITRPRLPADNEIICTLSEPGVPELARQIGNTRSAAAMDLWGNRMAGAVVAIGNAPTALFHLFELIDRGAPMPAAVIGMPVGFVGAAESKDALAADNRFESVIVTGRRGGSAMTVAAINALASDIE